mmetsp:Transcript_38192/g.28140  ORF Transcript_38192/g.28140 Transcript_38192/m.28140 type:complete len:128 (+) Transcript_38192:205-588(+)|eukprot:CAMPEP_0202978384 /NCGR_PEP_ID=MMETSP1396-20130829/84825_1 /ASSEMBLY_ACC=CAM_ASM_000872 /TAXON_ID= /ORGANISM="Pseudokeronopsis sp., Strain Brazil" /LENGTH=127 /DNA_ID=CAMNT_0049717335 /DNA_START=1514 /DNA_END=1897 /DNA_ORIENTATION=+
MKKANAFDSKYSGTTAVTLLVLPDRFVVANVGDSRCVLFQSKGEKEWEWDALSRDHKPNLAGESERIIAHNGRIDSYKDSNGGNLGPMRVWMKHEDSPGLAMSRSLGDELSKSLGVIATPDIKIYRR